MKTRKNLIKTLTALVCLAASQGFSASSFDYFQAQEPLIAKKLLDLQDISQSPSVVIEPVYESSTAVRCTVSVPGNHLFGLYAVSGASSTFLGLGQIENSKTAIFPVATRINMILGVRENVELVCLVLINGGTNAAIGTTRVGALFGSGNANPNSVFYKYNMNMSGVAGIYGLRRLVSGYRDRLFTIQREECNVARTECVPLTEDIYAKANGDADIDTLINPVVPPEKIQTPARILAIYDQSGHNGALVQGVKERQPAIMDNAGLVITTGGAKPRLAMRFSGGQMLAREPGILASGASSYNAFVFTKTDPWNSGASVSVLLDQWVKQNPITGSRFDFVLMMSSVGSSGGFIGGHNNDLFLSGTFPTAANTIMHFRIMGQSAAYNINDLDGSGGLNNTPNLGADFFHLGGQQLGSSPMVLGYRGLVGDLILINQGQLTQDVYDDEFLTDLIINRLKLFYGIPTL